MSASRCFAFPFHNALPSLSCLPLLPAPLRSDQRQTNSKASHLKTQRFLNENPPYPQTNKPKLFFSYSQHDSNPSNCYASLNPIKPNSIYHCRPHSPTKTFPKIDKYSCGQIIKRKGELKDKILNTYQLPLQTSLTTAVNNNSKEEEDGGTDIYGYCDHNIEREEKKNFLLKDKILNTYQLPLQTNPTTAMNNNSKEEEDGGTDIYGYCDHNIEK